jgi:hypothetical protein
VCSTGRREIDEKTVFGGRVRSEIDARPAFGSEFGVLGGFKKSEDWAAPNAEAADIRLSSG